VNVNPSNPQRSTPGQSPEPSPPARTERLPAASAGGAGSPAGSIELSAEARAFLKLRARLGDLPPGDGADRVARLRAAIASGTYAVGGEAIATALLRDPAAAAMLGVAPHA
jgi:flagellar biosynthesis anti-sigma factor FlgM